MQITDIRMSQGAMMIEERMDSLGHRADIVGGSVRDCLLGKTVSDFDMTTDATPEEIKEIFSDLRIIETGIKHGTVTVIAEGEPIELTTYRIDGGYRDHRHPDEVEFTRSLEEDLCRRDFTVNAMAYNREYGLTDLFGGREDLENRIIRAVGDPSRRFNEDSLRILRALRFSSVLGFSVEDGTADAIRDCRHLLSIPSRERVNTEWRKLIAGVNSYSVIKEFRNVIAEFIPAVEKCVLPNEEAWAAATPIARTLSLFVGMDDPQNEYCRNMRELRFDTATVELGKDVLAHYSDSKLETAEGMRTLLGSLTEKTLSIILDLRGLLDIGSRQQRDILNTILNSNMPYRISHLDIDGRDLISMGISGRTVGLTLESLLSAVIRGECNNERSELISLASKINLKA